MRKFTSIAMALLAFFAFSGGSVLAQSETSIDALMEQNNSGQSGTVSFDISDDGKTLTVEINLSNGTAEPQPAHIHTGTCENLDPKPFYPLNSVVNGKSVTVITEADIANLDYEASNQFAVNIHKSAAEASVYVACGDIVPGGNVQMAGMPRTGGGGGSGGGENAAAWLAFAALGLVATGGVVRMRFGRGRA